MKIAHNYYVYIVQYRDGSYYIGITNDIERRLWEHNTGYNTACYTYERKPVELKYFEHFTDSMQAITREKQLKGWSRKKKEALFKGDWNQIKQLAKSGSNQKKEEGLSDDPSTSSG